MSITQVKASALNLTQTTLYEGTGLFIRTYNEDGLVHTLEVQDVPSGSSTALHKLLQDSISTGLVLGYIKPNATAEVKVEPTKSEGTNKFRK